jgi:hypothetical protein
MGILGPVVDPTPFDFMACCTGVAHRSAIGAALVGQDDLRSVVLPHQLLEEFQFCFSVSALGNKGFKHLAFVADCAPQVMCLAVDLHEYFVEMPLPIGEDSRFLSAVLPNFRCKSRGIA